MSSRVIHLPKQDSETQIPATQIVEFEGDISEACLKYIRNSKWVAWDIETSGLNWKTEVIGICQLYVPNEKSIIIVKIGKRLPQNLREILSDKNICKIFHHAMFDLRFMCFHWSVKAENVACTKVAAKLLRLKGNKNGLQSILKHYLNVEIDKEKQVTHSNWLSKHLSENQIFYAAYDVVFLPALLEVLWQELQRKDLNDLAARCFQHLPTQVELEILDYNDIYGY